MTWREAMVAADRSHHAIGGRPMYLDRFDEVLSYHEPGLAPVRRGKLAWHIDGAGRAAYERRFSRTFGFYEGRAAVVSLDGWLHIGAEGLDAYTARYSWCGNFQGGCCAVRDGGGRYFHIERDGSPSYAARWRYAGDFREGLAVVQAADGRSTHIEASGDAVHGRWFRDLDALHKGVARARDDGGWTHVGRDGEPLYARRFAMVEPFYNGQARVEGLDGRLEVIDQTGQTVVELRQRELVILDE